MEDVFLTAIIVPVAAVLYRACVSGRPPNMIDRDMTIINCCFHFIVSSLVSLYFFLDNVKVLSELDNDD